MVDGQYHETDRFIAVDRDSVAFPDVEHLGQFSGWLSVQRSEWRLSVVQEPDRLVLRAESTDKLVTQSITPNSVHKRFVFDMKKQRFDPMRQEIRIEETDDGKLDQIESLPGVAAIRRYEKLGFSILKIKVDVNPLEVLRTLRSDFDNDNARILTGLFEHEPM